MTKKPITLFNVLVIILFGFMMMHSFVASTESKRNEFVSYCYFRNNLTRINQAVIEYARENEGNMPIASTWGDEIIKRFPHIYKDDFVSPASFSSYGVCYNRLLEKRQLSELKEETVVLFMADEGWNANGDKSVFHKHNHPYLITLSGDIYKYNPDDNNFVNLRVDRVITPEEICWK